MIDIESYSIFYTSAANVGGHMGGDYFMMNSLYKALNGEVAEGITYLDYRLIAI